MKVVIINFSGNVGKIIIVWYLLVLCIKKVEIVLVELVNVDEQEVDVLCGCDFVYLQQYMLVSDDLIVDIGVSNVEDFLMLMCKFKGSYEDFDYFVILVVLDVKQQKDMVNIVNELVKMGVLVEKIKIVFNCVEDSEVLGKQFMVLIGFFVVNQVVMINLVVYLIDNEIYQCVKYDGCSIIDLVVDKIDYKVLIVKVKDQVEKIEFVDKLVVK